MVFETTYAGCERRAKVLLKARPTPAQLVDRFAPPLPDGLELYLDAADISGDDWLPRVQANLAAMQPPAGFAWIVEGPLRSLDGSFFDITVPSEANFETLRRICAVARAIGAAGVNIHCINPVDDLRAVPAAERRQVLNACLGLLREYVRLCHEAGAVALIENIPPVARMREGRFMTSSIGIVPSDLAYACRGVDGLFVTLDVSHAQLYLNVTAGHALDDSLEHQALLSPLVEGLRRQDEAQDIAEYADALAGLVKSVHLSNAIGLLGEGMAFDYGNIDMERAVRRLSREADFLVTETLEPDPNSAVHMREAQRRIAEVLA